jgi:hypothetical protein
MQHASGSQNSDRRVVSQATKRRVRHTKAIAQGRMWLVAMLLGLLALAMQVGTVSAGPMSCVAGMQCIENVQVSPHGQFADISFHTNVSEYASIQVSTVPPKKLADGTLSYTNLPVDSFMLTPSGSQHSAEMDNLTPGTLYHYVINAVKGSVGTKDAQYQGTFTTLKRYVKATISEIDVIDDSDSLSAGDLVFNLYVGGSNPAIFPSAETTQWDSDEAKIVNMQATSAADDQVTVTLEGWDWDDSQQGWLIGSPIVIDSYNTSGIDGDGANVSKAFNVAGNGHDQSFTQNFKLETTNHSLKYRAFGSIHVFYAP